MARDVAWIMVGLEAEEGVAVFATTQLTRVELTEEVDEFFAWEQLGPIRENSRMMLNAEMSEYVMAFGSNWKEAFANLFRDWDPSQRDEIEPNPKQIGG